MRRHGGAEKDRADMQRVGHHLQQIQRDVGGVERGEDEQVRLARKAADRHQAAPQLL